MINVFGEEKFRNVIRFGKEIKQYLVTKDAQVYSLRSDVFLSKTITDKTRYIQFDLDVDKDLFDDYEYSNRGRDLTNLKTRKITVNLHRLVAETWMPIDEYPPDDVKEYWNQIITPDMVGKPRLPESVKQWVRDTALVDHIDDNSLNNHLDNLQWSKPKDNSNHRKKYNREKANKENKK